MDRYEEELQMAYKKARSIPTELVMLMPCMRFVGTIHTKDKSIHYLYYYEGMYYYDTDYARRFRTQMKNKRHIKK